MQIASSEPTFGVRERIVGGRYCAGCLVCCGRAADRRGGPFLSPFKGERKSEVGCSRGLSPRDFLVQRLQQEVSDVKHLNGRACLLKAGAKLQDAAGIGGNHDPRAGLQDVFDLSLL